MYEYDAFGNQLDADPNDTNPFRYCGQYLDNETGSYYLRARYYQPTYGRFLTADTHWNTGNMIYGDNPVKINERENPYNVNAPLSFAYLPDMTAVLQSGNLYGYALSNPVYYFDYTGKDAAAVLESGFSLAKSISDSNPSLGWDDLLAAAVVVGTVFVAGATAVADQFSKPKEIDIAAEKVAVDTVPQHKPPVFFTSNPSDFNPRGLVKTIHNGTKNGIIITWNNPATNATVFRWDENTNYSNGSHYHIIALSEKHFYAGEIVPEPYSSQYF